MSAFRIPSDPHGIIPTGWKKPGDYEVISFFSPAGIDVLLLRVDIRYHDYKDSSSSRDYIHVLQEYLATVDTATLIDTQNAYHELKGLT